MAKEEKEIVHTVQLTTADVLVVREALSLLEASRKRARQKVMNPAIAEAMDAESRFVSSVKSKF